MKKNFFALLLLCVSLNAISQEEQANDLLIADSTWTKEIIPFPIGFAQELDYEGIEEIRFAPGWSKAESPELWSYVFVWNITTKKDLTANDLEKDMQIYFDGLMSPENQDPELKALPTTALFIETEAGNGDANYAGKIRVFDRFRTKQMMTLNVTVEKHYCENKKKVNVLFRFSLQEFGHEVWRQLNGVKLKANSCDP